MSRDPIFPCGALGKHPPASIAARAVAHIAREAKPLALCVALDGSVTVESPGVAHPDTLLGVFDDSEAILEALLDESARRKRAPARRYLRNNLNRKAA